MTMKSSSVSLLFVLLLTVSSLDAFVVVPLKQRSMTCIRSSSGNSNSGNSGNGKNEDDIEVARRQLEFLVEDTTSTVGGVDLDDVDAPLLSTIGRERRQAEISLLRSLEYSDDSTAALWALWYGERGPQASLELHAIEQLFSDPQNWKEAEERLQALLQEHGVYFVEPVNRLATLYYLQGKFKDSQKMCQVVLEQKPWHIGALSGMVLVCANLNDLPSARQWAARRLPPLPPDGTTSPRRKEWVQRATSDAKRALEHEEKRVQLAFGKRQTYVPQQETETETEDDSWQ